MNLVIDFGNTRLKYGFFSDNEEVFSGTDEQELINQAERFKAAGEELNILLSGSGDINSPIVNILKSKAHTWLETSPLLKLPVNISYETPETLGFDRIANSVGAAYLFPAKEILIIDIGTAITYDYVRQDNCFIGGNISPGSKIRFRSLNEFTHRLPHLSPTEDYGQYGKNTNEAIVNGVMNGMYFEIKAYIEEFLRKNNDGKIIITGGDAVFFHFKIKNNVSFIKNIGLIGLNIIANHNKI